MNRGEQLVAQLLSDPSSPEFDHIAHELLTAFHHESKVDCLSDLLHSSNDRLASVGAWIASEIGENGKGLLKDLTYLLEHKSKEVRFWAIDCAINWTAPTNAREIALVVALVDDPEGAVRWKALGGLSRASRVQIEAAITHFAADSPASPYAAALKWLLGPSGTDPLQVIATLSSDNKLMRKVAVLAAFRMAQDDPEPLRCASASYDPEITQFAHDMLRIVSIS